MLPSHLERPEVVRGLDEGGEPVVGDEGLLVHRDDVAVTPSDPRNRPGSISRCFNIQEARAGQMQGCQMREGETWWDTSLHLRFIGLLCFARGTTNERPSCKKMQTF